MHTTCNQIHMQLHQKIVITVQRGRIILKLQVGSCMSENKAVISQTLPGGSPSQNAKAVPEGAQHSLGRQSLEGAQQAWEGSPRRELNKLGKAVPGGSSTSLGRQSLEGAQQAWEGSPRRELNTAWEGSPWRELNIAWEGSSRRELNKLGKAVPGDSYLQLALFPGCL